MKKIYCVIFSVMLVVFTMIPVTAFAYTGAANADYRAIAKDASISIPDNFTNYVVYTEKGKTDYVYCAFSSSTILIDVDTQGPYYRIRPTGDSTDVTIVRYSYDNIYKSPTSLCDRTHLNKGGIDTYCINPFTGEKYDIAYFSHGTKSGLTPHYSNYDFDNAGETFTQTPSTPTTPGTEGETTTPGAAVLGATMKKTNLSQVLSELIAVLPILLPVLISFIAIRKGLKFTLSQLRAA